MAITDGVVLMPPAFENGLDVWSSGNGTPGSDTYKNAINAAFVPADQDFGGCLELLKTQSVQKLRYMGETPLLPGRYLEIKIRLKAISGSLPSVRIAAWAGGAGGNHVGGLVEVAQSTLLTSYGNVVEVTGVVGGGLRNGVDMVWGSNALYGHFGLDLTGASGGVVRIDDVEITDITGAFLRDIISVVDVRDYGAVGDGATDDSAAFEAADDAANGRQVLVPTGTYYLNSSVTFNSSVQFEGTVTMPTDKMLILTKNFDLPAYIDAFDNEELAFKKAFQALLNNSDHDSLDMRGRKVAITEPIDVFAAVPNKSSYATRRVIRNGQLEAIGTTAWNTDVVTSQASYTSTDNHKLYGVVNVANIPIGSLVQANGVGREIYVRAKNVGAGEVTLSAPLYAAVGTQVYTFRRFKYLLDFSGMSYLAKFTLTEIEFQCNSVCSAVILPAKGLIFHAKDCFFTRPKDRGITSIGDGCQGMLIDRCQFLTAEDALNVSNRTSIGVNTNANDVKLRNNRATKFRHFAVIGGRNSIVTGNHFFQGDSVAAGVRSAGLVLTNEHTSTVVTSNYVDNCFIEWTNEHDSTPHFTSGYSFSALSVSDNIFLSGNVTPWFSYIVVKPYGLGHFLNGISITGNKFRSLDGSIDRVERVDTSFAGLDFDRTKNVLIEGNSYHSITRQVANPLRVKHNQVSEATTWYIDAEGDLPFGSRLLGVDSVVATNKLRNVNSVAKFAVPSTSAKQGTYQNQAALIWSEPLRGKVTVVVRMDA